MSEITYQPKVIQPNIITFVAYGKPFLNLSFLKMQLQKLSEQKMNAKVSGYFNLKELICGRIID